MFRNLQVEALFGGFLALVVVVVAAMALANSDLAAAKANRPAKGASVPVTDIDHVDDARPVVLVSRRQSDLACECYDKAFSLAGARSALAPEYRLGFEQCRARAGVDGGEAWTAGWTARTKARPYEASCKAYRRRRG